MVAAFCGRRSWTNRYSPGLFLGTGKEGVFHAPRPGSTLPAFTISSISLACASRLSPANRKGGTLTGTASGFSQISASPKGPRIGGSTGHTPERAVCPYSSNSWAFKASILAPSAGSATSMAPLRAVTEALASMIRATTHRSASSSESSEE